MVEGRNCNHRTGLPLFSPHRTFRTGTRFGAALATNEKPWHTLTSSFLKSFPSPDAKVSPNALMVELSSLTTRNTMLLKEVEKLRTIVSKDGIPSSKDLLLFLIETSKLLAENVHVARQSKQLLQHQQEMSEEAHKPPEHGYFPTNSLKWFGSTLETLGMCTDKRKDVEASESRKSLTEQAAAMTLVQKENAELHQQKECLNRELSNMRMKFEELEDQFKQAASLNSKSHLCSPLCDNNLSVDNLKEAINASEALLSEAKRGHANKKFRAKSASLEGLEVAVENGEEETLSAAIAAAQQADADAVDLEKSEEKLKVLRAMTQEQHAMKAARELPQKQKKTAFALVKKDDIMKFKELIDELSKSVSWCDWRNLLGRTDWCCVEELRVGGEQPDAKAQPRMSKQILQQIEQQQEQRQQQQQEDMNQTQCIPVDEHMEDAPVVQQNASLDYGECLAHAGIDSNFSTPCSAEDSFAISKSQAFRAAAQDDFGTLDEIIDSVSVDIWSKWENRAGKTLLTLSQERRSATVHSQLIKALGITKQIKRETFEEREAVWVYRQGDVQPRRATVLAETSEDIEMIPIEYWDGNEPATCVSRCSIRKVFSLSTIRHKFETGDYR